MTDIQYRDDDCLRKNEKSYFDRAKYEWCQMITHGHGLFFIVLNLEDPQSNKEFISIFMILFWVYTIIPLVFVTICSQPW